MKKDGDKYVTVYCVARFNNAKEQRKGVAQRVEGVEVCTNKEERPRSLKGDGLLTLDAEPELLTSTPWRTSVAGGMVEPVVVRDCPDEANQRAAGRDMCTESRGDLW